MQVYLFDRARHRPRSCVRYAALPWSCAIELHILRQCVAMAVTLYRKHIGISVLVG